MIAKKFEILDKGNNRFVLTITPDRVTIKLQHDSDDEDRARVIKFLTWVSEQPEMLDCTVAFRGRTVIPPTDIGLLIQMTNDNGKLRHTYREINME